MNVYKLITLLASVLYVSAASCQEGSVSAKEIREAWVGKSLIGTTSTGTEVIMKLQADGSASVTAGSTYDSGSWRTSEGGYCTTWRKIRFGKESCFTVVRSASRMTVLEADGSVSGYFTEVK